MNKFDFNKVSRLIRELMKARKLTYDELAAQVGMSGSGLKKLLSARDCSLAKLSRLCGVLEIDLGELLKSSEELRSTEIKFTPAQEAFFLQHPSHFFFFWELVDNDSTLEDLKAHYSLDDKSVRKYLTALDRIGVIELHPGDVVKHRYSGKTHWNMIESRVGQMAMAAFQDGFLRKLRAPAKGRRRMLRMTNFRLRKETYEEFLQAIDELFREYMKRSLREKPLSRPEQLIPAAALLGVAEFRFRDVVEIPRLG